jgi:3-oxoacyl-[acyl-carrier-protein] synthase-3
MTGRIIGTGSYVPDRTVSNHDLSKIVETDDAWIRERSGIVNRHLSESEGTTQMASEAARRALENAGVAPEELDIIILATSTQDNLFPAGACEVQALLGATRAVAFDLSAACSGFLFGISVVNAFIQSGMYRTGLVIGAETLSKIMDWTDRGTCILFGDGAGAAVIRADETGVRHTVMGSDGVKGPVLSCVARTNGNFLDGKTPEMGYTYMNGQEVFKFAVKKVPDCVKQLLEESKTDIDDVKYFILHQANKRIIEGAARKLGQPIEKFPMNLQNYGNTSSASIPLLLDEMNRSGALQRGDKVVMAGFGAGLTWGAALIEW